MSFKILVCIKQVPDTDDIKWTEHNTIQREGLESIINPFDLGSIELALKAKDMLSKSNVQAEIDVISMGPPQAKQALMTALALGCQNAFLLSDKKFSAADTLATAYTLSQFITTKIPDYKLIICGQQAIDGDTAQTPSSMAQKLNTAQITNAVALQEINEAYSIWVQDTKSQKRTVKSGFPLLVATTLKNIEKLPDINGYIRAQKTEIKVCNAEEINADKAKIGLLGSPTQVKKAFVPEIQRNTTLIENEPTNHCANYILNEIKSCKANNE